MEFEGGTQYHFEDDFYCSVCMVRISDSAVLAYSGIVWSNAVAVMEAFVSTEKSHYELIQEYGPAFSKALNLRCPVEDMLSAHGENSRVNEVVVL